jgi:hypothetical protein
MSGYYGYTNGPTDIEELWDEVRKLRTRVKDLEQVVVVLAQQLEEHQGEP